MKILEVYTIFSGTKTLEAYTIFGTETLDWKCILFPGLKTVEGHTVMYEAL